MLYTTKNYHFIKLLSILLLVLNISQAFEPNYYLLRKSVFSKNRILDCSYNKYKPGNLKIIYSKMLNTQGELNT